MEKIDPHKLPRHIAIIMDGNGRWAQKRLLNRIVGHTKGVDTIREIISTCRELGIPFLTLYAFSTENWNRPKAEVDAIMGLLKSYLSSEGDDLLKNNIRLGAIGQLERLHADVRSVLDDTIKKTESCNGMTLTLALSYGGRSEILHAVHSIMADFQDKKIKPDEVTPERFSGYLWTRGLPDPDLLIRTSGEFRLSNFLLWQVAYTELYVTDTYWPDFDRKELMKAITNYQSRERRFGMTSEQRKSKATETR